MSPRRSKTPHKPNSKLKNVSDEAENVTQEDALVTISLEKIVSTESQPRRYFEPQAMQSLVKSIKLDGILQPLLVRPCEGDKFELVAGERRYRAAQYAGLTAVPVIVREMSDEQAIQYALIENLQREDLSPIEETDAILQLLALRLGCDIASVPPKLYQMDNYARGKATGNVSGKSEVEIVEQVFASLGRNWQTFIRTRLPLLKLPPDILEALCAQRIEYTKAKEISKLASELERQELLEEAIAQSLSLSQIRERVKGDQPPTEGSELQARMEAASKLAKKLKVWSNPKKRQLLEALLVEIEALLSED